MTYQDFTHHIERKILPEIDNYDDLVGRVIKSAKRLNISVDDLNAVLNELPEVYASVTHP